MNWVSKKLILDLFDYFIENNIYFEYCKLGNRNIRIRFEINKYKKFYLDLTEHSTYLEIKMYDDWDDELLHRAAITNQTDLTLFILEISDYLFSEKGKNDQPKN